VVVDGSPDDSADRARAAAGDDERVRVLEVPHGGVCRARNIGLLAASAATYVTFLDADDELEPPMLERTMAWLDSRRDVAAVHCTAALIDRDGRGGAAGTALLTDVLPRYVRRGLWVRRLRDDERRTPFEAVLALAGIIPSVVVVRRSVLGSVGEFDEDLARASKTLISSCGWRFTRR